MINDLYSCKICDFENGSAKLFRAHLNLDHLECTAAEVNGNDGHLVWRKCQTCGAFCNGVKGLSQHRRTCGNDNVGNAVPGAAVGAAPVILGQLPANQPGFWPEDLDEDGKLDFLKTLCGKFQAGLYVVHNTWRPLLAKIIDQLLRSINEAEAWPSRIAMTAMLILPGLLNRIRRAKEVLPVVWLRKLALKPSFHDYIIQEAMDMGSRLPEASFEGHKPTKPDLVKQIEGRLDEGRVGAAAKVLSRLQALMDGRPAPVPLDLERIKAIIQALHPAAEDIDSLDDPPVEGDPAGMELTGNEVLAGIRRLPKETAAGSSGWSNKALMAVVLTADKVLSESICARLAVLFNRGLSGELDGSVAAIWSVSRAALIPKDDEAWRPLGIGEGWYRLMGRVINRKCAKTIGDLLNPLQLCVGVSGGCEIAARIAQLAYDADAGPDETMSLILLDLQNAFNLLSRKAVFEGLKLYAPYFVRWFRTFYGRPRDLRLLSGDVVGVSACGLMQGDPLAMSMFSVGYHIVLRALDARVKAVKIELGSIAPVGVIGLADDTTLYMGSSLVARMEVEIQEVMAEYRVKLNVAKCKVLQHGELIQEEDRFKVVSGARILGNFVGDAGYREDASRRSLVEMSKSLPALAHIPPNSAMIILERAINARPVYLTRVMEPEIIAEPLREFDMRITKAIVTHVLGNLPEDLVELVDTTRGLPKAINGFGVVRHSREAGLKACRGSRALIKSFVYHYAASLIHKWKNGPL